MTKNTEFLYNINDQDDNDDYDNDPLFLENALPTFLAIGQIISE